MYACAVENQMAKSSRMCAVETANGKNSNQTDIAPLQLKINNLPPLLSFFILMSTHEEFANARAYITQATTLVESSLCEGWLEECPNLVGSDCVD